MCPSLARLEHKRVGDWRSAKADARHDRMHHEKSHAGVVPALASYIGEEVCCDERNGHPGGNRGINRVHRVDLQSKRSGLQSSVRRLRYRVGDSCKTEACGSMPLRHNAVAYRRRTRWRPAIDSLPRW